MDINWKAFYEKEASFKRFIPEEQPVNIRGDFIRELIPKDVITALDVGCGDGWLCGKLSNKYKIAGVDIALPRVSYAKSHFKSEAFLVSNIYDLPFADNSYDAVICGETLEHIEDFSSAVKELIRVSKKYVVATVPNNQPKTTILCPHCLRTFYLDGHINSFDKTSFAEIFSNFGKIIKLKDSTQMGLFNPNKKHHIEFPNFVSQNLHIWNFLLSLGSKFFPITVRNGDFLGIVCGKR
ncbi:MAG: class I SAM-dependent methyltransferase [bacterium]|nr:class I SAM-dependent methyltransferase [bacterium]